MFPFSSTSRVIRIPLRTLGAVAACAILLVASFGNTPAAAETSDEAASRAAAEIQAARDRANEAADDLFEAQHDREELLEELDRLETEQLELESMVEQLRRDVEGVALGRYVDSGGGGIPLFTGTQAPLDQVQAEVFVDVLRNHGVDVLDQYDVARQQLEANADALADQRAEIESHEQVFEQLRTDAQAEVVRLRDIEEGRLQDEAVQQALLEQQQAAQAKWDEQIRRNAEQAAKAQPNPGLAVAVDPVVVSAAEETTTDGEIVPEAGAVTPPPNVGASGGTSGGRTGVGGVGSSARGIDTGAGYIDNIVCPMSGSAHGDSWGGPRSEGRLHEGVDMLAPRGTPIVAVTSGQVTFKQNQLGGNAASLIGHNGNRYYYAHFDAYEGSSRSVEQGEVIGYNGDTGNAVGTPHLHFEIHPGGGVAVNPTPSVRYAGC
jgi:peptidoglycan LD-endopeptidase LytH